MELKDLKHLDAHWESGHCLGTPKWVAGLGWAGLEFGAPGWNKGSRGGARKKNGMEGSKFYNWPLVTRECGLGGTKKSKLSLVHTLFVIEISAMN